MKITGRKLTGTDIVGILLPGSYPPRCVVASFFFFAIPRRLSRSSRDLQNWIPVPTVANSPSLADPSRGDGTPYDPCSRSGSCQIFEITALLRAFGGYRRQLRVEEAEAVLVVQFSAESGKKRRRDGKCLDADVTRCAHGFDVFRSDIYRTD